ncbi:MAG: FAD:protein FMN transferase, partial [Clostridiaceae bacterium]|nr:FAD:protein FMN transferase [Clostridiaceae bacterium]
HKNYNNISRSVIERINQIEARMTINQEGGEINRLNASAGKEFVPLSEDTLFVLNKAKEYAQLSGGSFDMTVGPITKAWGIFTDSPKVPTRDEIQRLLNLVDYRDLEVIADQSEARLKDSGQIVDLGAIAKGYAADEAIKIYKDNGVKSAFISLGGNVATLGGKPDGTPWKVGIRNPRGPEGSYIGIVSVKDKAVVSSGDYERYFEEDGVKYHHIMDPRTGYPSDSGLIGTTIISDASIDADALSTAVFVMGLNEGLRFVESLDGVEAVLITDDKKVYVTTGLISSFEFKDGSKEFEYVEKR